jgi:hypothetical protein
MYICLSHGRSSPWQVSAVKRRDKVFYLLVCNARFQVMTTNLSDSGVSHAKQILTAGGFKSSSHWDSIVTYVHNGWSSWQLLLTILLLLVTYDQGKIAPKNLRNVASTNGTRSQLCTSSGRDQSQGHPSKYRSWAPSYKHCIPNSTHILHSGQAVRSVAYQCFISKHIPWL